MSLWIELNVYMKRSSSSCKRLEFLLTQQRERERGRERGRKREKCRKMNRKRKGTVESEAREPQER